MNEDKQKELRKKFINETKKDLWPVNPKVDCGFSEDYVFWLEDQLLNKVIKVYVTEADIHNLQISRNPDIHLF